MYPLATALQVGSVRSPTSPDQPRTSRAHRLQRLEVKARAVSVPSGGSGLGLENKALGVSEMSIICGVKISLEPASMYAKVKSLVALGHEVNHRLSSSQWFAAKATSRLNNDARNLFIEHLQALRKQ
jgi:hypothetical protein